MRWYARGALCAFAGVFMSVSAMAQNDICASAGGRETSDQARAEQLRIQAQERTARELERRSWEIKMFPVKNLSNNNNYSALCIFRVEVVLQSQLKLVQVRAPKEMMPAIEEALKTLDVPPPPIVPPTPPRGVELTAYVLVVAERATNPSWKPVPRELESVVNSLKSILPNDSIFLADTVVARGTERQSIGVTGGTVFNANNVTVRDGVPPVIRLDNLNVQSNGAGFGTSIDVPVGAQVVVGKATANFGQNAAVVLVLSSKLLN